jgi:hypothetical protein
VVVWARVREPLIVVAMTAFTALVSQRWTGWSTPDSSFYLSLGRWGAEVTDRAPIPSYYWTRLGEIVPLRLLTGAFGTWPGLTIYRLALLLLIVAAVYIALRRFTGVWAATFLTLGVSLSTVVLSFLGNPYLTGAAMAGIAVVIACALIDGWRAASIAGVGLGWLIMVNPAAVLLAGVVWLVLRIHARTRLLPLFAAAATTVLTFLAFLAAGRIVFPRMQWFQTYLDANARITYSNFASKDPIWLHDISLIVPVMVLLLCIGSVVMRRRKRAAQKAVIISSSSIAFMLVFNPLMGGIALEAPMYQSMLWPPALIAFALAASAWLPEAYWTYPQRIVGAVGIVAILIAGHVTWHLPLAWGWVIGVALVAITLAVVPRAAVLIAALALFLVGAQLLQNARGDLGLYFHSPYAWAFASNPISERAHAAVNTEQWLLDHTTDSDTILDWVGGQWVQGDRELYVVAGMQLWGENRVTLEPRLAPGDISRLESIRPSVIAMYAPTTQAIVDFWSTIPAAQRPSAPECYDFPWAPNPASSFQVTEGHACLTRLTW